MSLHEVLPEPLSDTAVRLSVHIKRPPQRVYEAWLSPDDLAKWFVPQPGASCWVHEMDARIGGGFRFTVDSCGDPTTATGRYTVLEPHRRIAFTWAWENMPGGVTSQITLDFLPDGDGTRLVLTHEKLADLESRGLHTQGWSGCLDSIASYLESH